METIVVLVLGLIFGGIVGALVMLLVKGKGRDSEAELRSKLDVTTSRLEETNLLSDKYKKDAEEQRGEAEAGKIAIAKLQAEFEASKSRFVELEQVRDTVTDELKQAQERANDRGQKIAGLETRLKSANERRADFEQANADLKERVDNLQDKETATSTHNAELQANLDAANKRLSEQTDIEKTLKAQFAVMVNQALANNNDVFMKAADEKIGSLVKQAKSDFSLNKDAVSELVKPLSDELKRIETARAESQGNLTQQITALMENNTNLANEARNLSTALKRPEVRGSWGEIQLERVAELAGLVKDRDYRLQVSVSSESGIDRPDMVLDMPNGRNIVVDAKAPMSAYLDAVNSDNESEQEELMQRHASQVRARARGLAQKSYQQKFNSPDFVVMFLPSEVFLQSALQRDPELLEWSMEQKVVIATPNTLLALLKTVAMGWREVQLAEEAAKIGELGQELYDKLYTFAEHMNRMRGSLNSTVSHFNKGIGSLEGRNSVFDHARRFKELGISSTREIPEISEVDIQVRQVNSATLYALSEPDVTGDD